MKKKTKVEQVLHTLLKDIIKGDGKSLPNFEKECIVFWKEHEELRYALTLE